MNCDPVILPAVDALPATTTVSLVTNEEGEPEGFTWPPTASPIVEEEEDNIKVAQTNSTVTNNSTDAASDESETEIMAEVLTAGSDKTTSPATQQEMTTSKGSSPTVTPTRRTSPQLFQSTTTQVNSLAIKANQQSGNVYNSGSVSRYMINSVLALTSCVVALAVSL